MAQHPRDGIPVEVLRGMFGDRPVHELVRLYDEAHPSPTDADADIDYRVANGAPQDGG
jgi:hypothetical protein